MRFPDSALSARRRKVATAREKYQPGVPSPVVPREFQLMWDDMTFNGVPQRGSDPPGIDDSTLSTLRNDPFMRVVLDRVRGLLLPEITKGLVAVADARCHVLLAAGDDEARELARLAGLTEGVIWSCLTGGLNGLGRAVADRKANQTFAECHWRTEQFELVCDVVPIMYRGRVIAALNITDHWTTAHNNTLPMLKFFAARVEDSIAETDRDGQAQRCAAGKLLDRCGAPALVMQGRTVIAASDVPLRPGDTVDFPSAPAVGHMCLRQLGCVVLEPLEYEDYWLVRMVSHSDEPTMRVTFDFTDRYNPVIRVRGTAHESDYPISRPRYAEVLAALCHSRAGMDVKALSSALYNGDPGQGRNVRPLMSRLRDEIWWLLEPRGYRLAEQLVVELR